MERGGKMQIDAQVKSISDINQFFIVPDYQREYVWKANDQVKQFITDIDNAFETSNNDSSYYLGSVIIVKKQDNYDVIDGQQRLTTIVLTLCALKDFLESITRTESAENFYNAIKSWLSTFNMKTASHQNRVELQYEESQNYLSYLIHKKEYKGKVTPSIQKMQAAYDAMYEYVASLNNERQEHLVDFIAFFFNKIVLVFIVSADLHGALKIFETSNQRGASLDAMDLVKNLIFSEANEKDFPDIKAKWKIVVGNIHACKEGENPLRFLRYFLMARYCDNGILREEDIYKWIISEGEPLINYKNKPIEFVNALLSASERYSKLVNATSLVDHHQTYPAVVNIGYINKYMSRQHLLLLLALDVNCEDEVINYLAKQLETLFFVNNTLGIQAKYNENNFSIWVQYFRGLKTIEQVKVAVEKTIAKYITKKAAEFKQTLLTKRHDAFNPLYRLRYILGTLENKAAELCNMPLKDHGFIQNLQVEHILPQTPKADVIPEAYGADYLEYSSQVYMLGNVTLLESQINQAVNNFNDLSADWFKQKQSEYKNSALVLSKMLDVEFSIGKNTSTNQFIHDYNYAFNEWNKEQIQQRQQVLLNLALLSWTINGQRIDQYKFTDEEEQRKNIDQVTIEVL